MKKSVQLLAALLAFSGASFAQTNSAPAAADATKLALAREAIAAVHADKMFDGMVGQMKQMAMQTSMLPPEATPEQRKLAEELQGKIMDLSMNAAKGLVAQMDQIYAAVYSEAELKAMVAFFKSPEGQTMMEKQPQIMQHIMPLVQQMQRDLMPQIQRLVEEAKAAEAKAAAPAPTATPAAAEAPAPGK